MKAIAKPLDKDNLPHGPDGRPLRSWGQIFVREEAYYAIHCITLFEEELEFLVIDDTPNFTDRYYPDWYPSPFFDVSDTSIPHDWICRVFDDKLSFLIGPEFMVKDQVSFEAIRLGEPEPMALFWERLDRLIKHDAEIFTKQVMPKLSFDALRDVEALLPIGEINYAFEIACADLLENELLSSEEQEKCIYIGRKLGLDEGETIEWDFWKRLINYQSPPGIESAPPVVMESRPMKVRALEITEGSLPKHPDGTLILKQDQIFLTSGIEYEVHGLCIFGRNTFFRLIDDRSSTSLYPAQLFAVSDGRIPSEWICNIFHEEPKLIMGPEHIATDVSSFNSSIDNQIEALRLLRTRTED